MELKKSEKADLENRRYLFLAIGFCTSLLLVTSAFEWKYEQEPIIGESELRTISCYFPTPEDLHEEEPTLEYSPPITMWKDGEIFTEAKSENCVFIVEEMPSFPGGFKSLLQFLEDNIVYPEQAVRMGIEGRVFVKFIVEKDGTLSNIEVVKGVGAGIDDEALRVMKLVPRFSPGKQGDIRVRVQMVVPINFQLD